MKKFPSKNWIRPFLLFIILIGMVLFARHYFTSLFFIPDKEILTHPSTQRLSYEDVTFPTENGDTLHGFFLKPTSPPKGTVVHCHGNAGNVSSHYTLMLFLVESGYNVLTFDYSGYGQSEGQPTPKGIITDTLAALAYVRTRRDVEQNKIILFGQSLGGAAAAGAMARDTGVAALILEGAFTTYRQMASKTQLGKLLFFLTPFVIPDIGPKYDLKKTGNRPILIVHGELDGIVPAEFAPKLYEAALHKKKLAVLKDFHHLQGAEENPDYSQTILSFLNNSL